MAVQIIVPAEGGAEDCYLSKWNKKTGDQVFVGDLLCEVETGKAIVAIVAPVDGYLLSTLYEAGDEVPVLAPIATIGALGESIGWIGQQEPEPQPVPAGKQPENLLAVPLKNTDKVIASPRAKKYARENNLQLDGISGTGYLGSIIERDVVRAKL